MTPDDLVEQIATLETREQAIVLWREHRAIWTAWHTGLVTLRLNL